MISVIIPILNEAETIGGTLDALAGLPGNLEVIVVDGQSHDDSVDIARKRGALVLSGTRGRGQQLRVGAEHAKGEVLWFLHADSVPSPEALARIDEAVRLPDVAGGNFDLLFAGSSTGARMLTRIYPHLRKLGLSYGDSGIFVRRDSYDAAGGFRAYPIFEDLDLMKRVRKQGRFVHLKATIITSSRRFENGNFALVFAKWTALQILYWAGVNPTTLGRWYSIVR